MPTVAILAALRHAERTGEGQHVDMALLDTQVAMLANLGANYLVSGKVPGRAGNAHQNIVPYQVFEVAAASPDAAKDYLILAVGNDNQYAKFCEVAGRPDLAVDPRFAKNQDRVRNRELLVPVLEDDHEAVAARPTGWPRWKQPRCRAAPINNLAEVFDDPQVNERGMVTAWHAPVAAGLAPGVQPDEAERDPGAKRPAAAAAGPAHGRGVARAAGLHR